MAGYLLFVALMAAGYYYNVTFVQLGLVDLGTRLVGMDRAAVAAWMAGLALAGAWIARRRPTLLENVGDSIAAHTAVSAVAGAVGGATLLVMFVYTAFTLVLIPLSVL